MIPVQSDWSNMLHKRYGHIAGSDATIRIIKSVSQSVSQPVSQSFNQLSAEVDRSTLLDHTLRRENVKRIEHVVHVDVLRSGCHIGLLVSVCANSSAFGSGISPWIARTTLLQAMSCISCYCHPTRERSLVPLAQYQSAARNSGSKCFLSMRARRMADGDQQQTRQSACCTAQACWLLLGGIIRTCVQSHTSSSILCDAMSHLVRTKNTNGRCLVVDALDAGCRGGACEATGGFAAVADDMPTGDVGVSPSSIVSVWAARLLAFAARISSTNERAVCHESTTGRSDPRDDCNCKVPPIHMCMCQAALCDNALLLQSLGVPASMYRSRSSSQIAYWPVLH
jgi:hypothetical protein